MQIRFVPRELGELDKLDVEVLIACAFEDVRPARGLWGLCDWRLGGRLSGLMRDGFITGAFGEVLMVPGKPVLAFDKLILLGGGACERLDKPRFTELVRASFLVLSKLRARAAVVELPGREEGLMDAIEATDIVLDEAERAGDCDVWTLVEDSPVHAVLGAHAAERRRRRRVYGG